MHNDINSSTWLLCVCVWVCMFVLFSCFLFAGQTAHEVMLMQDIISSSSPQRFRKQQVVAIGHRFVQMTPSAAEIMTNSNSPQNQTIEDKYQGGDCLARNHFPQIVDGGIDKLMFVAGLQGSNSG